MLVTASSLSSYQRCPRQFMLGLLMSDQRRWRPRSLFVNVLRNAIQRISNGESLDGARTNAATAFLEKAAKPGLDVSCDPFELAQCFASILKTVITRVYAGVAPGLKAGPTIVLSPTVKWSCRALADVTGALHLWNAVESVNDDTLARLFHSWHVLGELATTGMPMMLHLIEIGRQSGSHQLTPWCRAYAHPYIMHRFAFQSKGGKPLVGKWKPVYYQDSRRNDPDTWVEMMERDEVRLYHAIPVRPLAPAQVERIRLDIEREAGRMEAILQTNWKDEPMRRTSCDTPPCYWQNVCYK